MLFEEVALASEFPEFLTLPAYDYLLEHVEKAEVKKYRSTEVRSPSVSVLPYLRTPYF